MFRRSKLSPAIRHSGNTMLEYGLIGSLVVLVCIAAFSDVGSELKAWFTGIKGDMKNQVSATATANASQLKAMTAYEAQQALKKVQQGTPSGGLLCPAGGCASLAIQPYDPAQTAGANGGIDIVDEYANKIKALADELELNSNVHPDFIEMLVDLADEGHRVAGDERSVLTYTQSSDGGFDFSIQDRYHQTENRAMNYLNAHPNELTPEQVQLLRQASDNIKLQMADFIGNADPGSLSGMNINQKFTDSGGGKGATYVDTQATKICGTSGSGNCN